MISAFVPISDSFVVAGTSESHIKILQFPNLDHEPSFSSSLYNLSPAENPDILWPTSTSTIGKCSHHPVNDITHLNSYIAAVSACTLSIWDLTKNSRVRLVTTPDHSTCCTYVGTKLLAVAGHGRSVHLYDTRLQNQNSAPVWSVLLASDNLYTIAADGDSFFCGSADGSIYGVDLRAHRTYKWALQPNSGAPEGEDFTQVTKANTSDLAVKNTTNAILDLKIAGDVFFVTRESGQVCGVPRTFQGDEASARSEKEGNIFDEKKQDISVNYSNFMFADSFSCAPVRSKIGCDVLNTEHTMHIAAGGVCGHVSYYEYEKKTRSISSKKSMKVASEASTVASVRWAPRGLYASTGDSLCLLPYIT